MTIRLTACLLLACGLAQATPDPHADCLRALAADERLAALAPHVALADALDAPAALLDDAATPAAHERAAVRWWMEGRARCADAASAFRRQNIPPVLIDIAARGEAGLARLAAELERGRLAYGSFNRRALALATDTQQAHRDAVRALRQARQLSGRGQRLAWEMSREAAARPPAPSLASAAARTAAPADATPSLQASLATHAMARQRGIAEFQLNAQQVGAQAPIPPSIAIPPRTRCSAAGSTWTCSPQ